MAFLSVCRSQRAVVGHVNLFETTESFCLVQGAERDTRDMFFEQLILNREISKLNSPTSRKPRFLVFPSLLTPVCGHGSTLLLEASWGPFVLILISPGAPSISQE